MTAIARLQPGGIFTSPYENDDYVSESKRSIGTSGSVPEIRWLVSQDVRVITTFPEASAEGYEWIEKAASLLRQIFELPANWDGEGSPRPDPAILAAASRLLSRLENVASLGAVPAPFVCPIAGGGIQFEWTSQMKHLEIEFLDDSTIAFLKEEQTPQGEVTQSGEYLITDTDSTRRLLDWFATV